MKSIAIESECGSGGSEIGKAVASRLKIVYYEGKTLIDASKKYGIPIKILENYGKNEADKILYHLAMIETKSQTGEMAKVKEGFRSIQEIIELLHSQGTGVFYGHGATEILGNCDDVIRVLVYSSQLADRIQRVQKQYSMPKDEAVPFMERSDAERENYYKLYSHKNWKDCSNYDIVLNTSKIPIERCVQILEHEMKYKG